MISSANKQYNEELVVVEEAILAIKARHKKWNTIIYATMLALLLAMTVMTHSSAKYAM